MVFRQPWPLAALLLTAAAFVARSSRDTPLHVGSSPAVEAAAICPKIAPARTRSGPAPDDLAGSDAFAGDVPYAVSVTPDGSPTTVTANTSGNTRNFTVTNTGDCPDTYSLSYSATGPITGVTLSKTSGTGTVTATFSVGAAGTGVLTLYADGAVGGASDQGSYNVTVTAPPTPAVSVTPHSGTAPTRTANTGGYNQTFTVTNTGNVQTTYTLTCAGSSNVTCTRTSLTSVTLAAGAATTDTTYYSVGAPGTGTLSLTAAGSGVSDVGSYTVPVVSYGVAVTPKGATTANRLTNTGGYGESFTLTNTGSSPNTYTVACTGSANVTCAGVSVGSVTLNVGANTTDTARYSVGAVGTGTLSLTASGTNASDAGSYSIPVVSASPQPPVVDVTSVNPGALSERSVCLTIAMGQAAAAECGDLRVVHALPTTRTLNKARTPTLLYNSAFAHAYPLVAANVTLPPTALVPDSITATLTINAAVRARGTWAGTEWTPGKTRRVVLGFDGLTDATGVYAYTLDLRNWYGASSQPTSVTGQLAIVNRAGSAFGAGWWLAGLERLDIATMLWVGGDGAVRQYQPVPGQTNVWVAPNVDYPDTLRKDGSGNYVRSDKDSVRVKFDPTGVHIATINRKGHTTTFSYVSGRLAAINLPPTTTKVYRFTYDANGMLQAVDAPGPDGIAPRTTTVTVTSGRVSSIRDPNNTTVAFAYDPSYVNRLTSRTDRRGTVTTYVFDAANKIARASINMGSGKPSIVTSLVALESRGLPASGTPSSVDTAVAYSKFDGARTDVGDTTAFWLDRFGAPRKIVDASGNATLLTRAHALWPVLVTRLQYPTGQVISAAYDSRGNVTSTTDSSAVSGGRYATTTYEWDPKWDAVRKITRPERDSLTFAYDPATGNLVSQEDGRGPVSQVTFGYNAANQVISVTRPNTPIERIGYDPLGNLDSTTTAKGYLTTYQNDSVGRVTLISSPIDTVAGSTRREAQQLFYDAMDRDTLTISAGPAMSPAVPSESMFVRKRYNPNGQLDSLSRSARPDVPNIGMITTRWKYDTAGRTIVEIAPDGLPDSTFYDPAGNDTLKVTRRRHRISSAYDAVNRLTTRRVPAVGYAERPAGITTLAGGLPTVFPAYQVPGDTQTFTYDAMGRLLTARNADARVKRSYYTNGLLETDSLRIRTVQGWDSTLHVYGLSNQYDLDGRRTGLGTPLQLDGWGGISFAYDPQFGALTSVVQIRDGGIFTFKLDIFGLGYTSRGELASIDWDSHYTQYTQSFTYDADGRVVADTIRNLGDTAYPRFGADPVRAIRYAYDARSNLLYGADPIGYKDTLNMGYSGLGHLVQSNLSQLGKVPNCGNTTRYAVAETFKYDGLGDRYRADKAEAITVVLGCATASTSFDGSAFTPGTGRLMKDTIPGGVTSYTYNEAGDLEFSQNLGGPAQEQASYYAADGKLRAVDSRRAAGPHTNFGFWTRAFDEYRYDALGRRIWVRSRKTCQDSDMNIAQATECKTSILRRVIWDGNQILAEIQMPGDSTARDIPYWENDTAAVQLAPITAGPGNGDPSRYFGSLVYAHGGAFDHPLSITRFNYVYAINDAGFTVSPPVVIPRARIMPFWNALGDAPLGAFTNGGVSYCTPPTSTTDCEGVFWPYTFSAYDRQNGTAGRTNWQGSLLENGRDKSGMEFKRNRYYDPQTGRFTQEDPIGLAGGLNVYGFAKGTR